MKLITEEAQKVEFLTEGTGKNKKMFIEGIFLQGDICNRNGRMYPMSTLSREVKRYNEQFIQKGRALGELNHPPGPTVNLDRVSHKIVALEQCGTNFKGKAQLLQTPMGKIAESLINSGVTLGVSSRGVGSLREDRNGYKVVGEDFMLATAADIVADPSAPDAFVQGIMEGVEWIYDVAKNEWLVESTKNKVNRLIESRQYQERKLELFNEFLSNL
jgi:ribosomal protein L37AE/L43A